MEFIHSNAFVFILNRALNIEKRNFVCLEIGKIFALQAEALLKLRRPQDADEALKKGPNFDTDECTKFFGPIGSANLLLIRAQVDMAAGR